MIKIETTGEDLARYTRYGFAPRGVQCYRARTIDPGERRYAVAMTFRGGVILIASADDEFEAHAFATSLAARCRIPVKLEPDAEAA